MVNGDLYRGRCARKLCLLVEVCFWEFIEGIFLNGFGIGLEVFFIKGL